MRQINDEGLALLKSLEDCRLKPYKDIAGVWTIGYGSTHGVTKDTPPITQMRADNLLLEDLTPFEKLVDQVIDVPLNENQYASLVVFAFNIGATAFIRSTLRKKLNRGQYLEAANEFEKWRFAGGKESKGLVNRRNAERSLFLRPVLIT